MAIDVSEIARVSALVGDLARHDVSGLPQDDFLEAFDAVARLGRFTDTLRARFAGEIARRSTPDLPGGGLARRQGFGNAGQMVSRATGGTQASAKLAIEAGLALVPEQAFQNASPGPDASGEGQPTSPTATRYPAVAEAVLADRLMVDAAGLITSGLETIADRVPSDRLHELERRLVDKAVPLALQDVRRLVASAVARADLPGLEERERRHHAERFMAWKEDHHGMVTFTGKLDAVTAAPIRTVIEQIVTHQFRARRDQDPASPDQRTVGQMRADALALVCRHAVGCKETDSSGIRTTIIVRINKSDLNTGHGLGSIDGTNTPISVNQLRRLAGDAGIIPAVLAGDSEVLDLGREVRLFTRTQRLALLERDGGCAKCHAPPEHCEAHHIQWWEHGGPTNLSNGVMLCTRCHHDIHRQNWNILVRANRVDFIPPPTINPTRQPRPGGLAAIHIDDVSSVGDADGNEAPILDHARDPEPQVSGPQENSAQNEPAGYEPAQDEAQRDDPAQETSATHRTAPSHAPARRAA